MSSETIFYILGGLLVASALVVSFAGLRSESFPGRAFPALLLYFVVLVLATTTFAVRGSKDEQEARAAEQASEQASEAAAETTPAEGGGTAQAPAGEQGGGGAAPQPPKGPGGKLKISADPTQLAFDKKTLTSKPGPVTVIFTNPAPIAHNFAVEESGKLLGQTPLITSSTASKTIDLAPGSYTFLCTVPGHAQAGMQGTLTVK
jgi:plastocyanin